MGATERCRFAPTPSGPAHPGTLLAALLCWLDARSRGAPVLLRLEDVDRQRCSPEQTQDMRLALRWLGLDWDDEIVQSERRPAHEAALDRLAAQDLLYPCTCSRALVQRAGTRAADGGWRYPGTCRESALPNVGWRGWEGALRLRLPHAHVKIEDESGSDLSQDPFEEMGDPILRRRDGAMAYHLAVVVDDAEQGITRVVRGRDLAASTAIHRVLQQALSLPSPTWRHHLLLLEEQGGKLAKLHGAVGWRTLRESLSAEALCGVLAAAAGLVADARETTPRALLEHFDWRAVRHADQVMRWSGVRLLHLGAAPQPSP
ncbi:MAG: glutamate--tRNA ligase family protein [Myxococcota bacterium]|nr:glutamate--tRNA ligase family protein [Myxococcota bacterium]